MIFLYDNIRPNHFAIGPITVNIYWIIFVAGIFIIHKLLTESFRTGHFSIVNKQTSTLINYPQYVTKIVIFAAIGLQLGGRIGYVLFRMDSPSFTGEPLWYLREMGQGVSFRGALIGAFLASWIASRNLKLDFLRISDILSFVAPTFLFLARISEFINHPLPGIPTHSAFGVIYPGYGDIARHPVRLYQALLEGLLLQLVLHLNKKQLARPGRITALFLLGFVIAGDIAALFRDTSITPPMILGGVISLRHFVALLVGILSIFLLMKKEKSKASLDGKA